jgi:hypothetical protein
MVARMKVVEFSERLRRFQRARGDAMPWADASIVVHDTLEMAASIAVSVFGEDAPPDLVFEIYDRLYAERRRAADE